MKPPVAADVTSESAVQPVIDVVGVTKNYGKFVAVDNVSLSVHKGEILVLLGESGSGKTTILRCVAGLDNVTTGQLRIAGDVVDDGHRRTSPESRRLGMVFQSYALWPQMSVLQNVAFAGRRASETGLLSRREAVEQATQLLETVGMARMKDRLPSQLSGGQQQRVALARALAGNVRLLLMDEPLSALDQALREELRLGLREQIRRSGLACLYVTHDQEEALAMADTLAVMKNGVVVEHGDPRSCFERPKTIFGASFLGARNALQGTVVLTRGALATAVVDGEVISFSPMQTMRAGDRAEFRFRRRHTTLGPLPQEWAGNAWRARILSSAYLGHGWEVSAHCLGATVRAWTTTEPSAEDSHVLVPPEQVLGYLANAAAATGASLHEPSSGDEVGGAGPQGV